MKTVVSNRKDLSKGSGFPTERTWMNAVGIQQQRILWRQWLLWFQFWNQRNTNQTTMTIKYRPSFKYLKIEYNKATWLPLSNWMTFDTYVVLLKRPKYLSRNVHYILHNLEKSLGTKGKQTMPDLKMCMV